MALYFFRRRPKEAASARAGDTPLWEARFRHALLLYCVPEATPLAQLSSSPRFVSPSLSPRSRRGEAPRAMHPKPQSIEWHPPQLPHEHSQPRCTSHATVLTLAGCHCWPGSRHEHHRDIRPSLRCPRQALLAITTYPDRELPSCLISLLLATM
ncbi:hypothetical protein P171DRAFT_121441 [Karstenula rhodostoma CBS 690.94]|uniref:Uncharacterized protein n=1 Tax=Karstenula rhodostoma CBS 690.94 TaxID=1392251 RepID=A0A9P4P8K4_9PLEO|nr:hypothetical protein P171DRAFT_121441 [Karstenula rhodostoma CBS 690.94]